jgi:hypothetical protein
MLITCLSFTNSSSSSEGLGGGVGEGGAEKIGETGVKELDTSGEEVYTFFLVGVIEVGFTLKFSLNILYAL